MSRRPAQPVRQPRPRGMLADGNAVGGRAAEFERLYRANVADVTAYFARRSTDPQAVADLAAETFTAAITSFGTFDPRKGTARAWVFGIARRVYAAHCESLSQQRAKVLRLAGRGKPAPTTSPSCSTGSTPNGPGGPCSPRWRSYLLGPGGDRAGEHRRAADEGSGERARRRARRAADAAHAGPGPSCVTRPAQRCETTTGRAHQDSR